MIDGRERPKAPRRFLITGPIGKYYFGYISDSLRKNIFQIGFEKCSSSGSISDSCSDSGCHLNHRGKNFSGFGVRFGFEFGFVFGFEFERVRVWIRVRFRISLDSDSGS